MSDGPQTGHSRGVYLLARTPLFEGLAPEELDEIAGMMRSRRYGARELICRQGEPGTSLFVIGDGLAQVMISSSDSGRLEPVARLRRGDVVGEMSLVTGEPRSATVVAGVPTHVLELGQEAFASVLARHPAILGNLTRILSRRLVRTMHAARRQRGEAIALLVAPAAASLAGEIVSATRAASPQAVTGLEIAADGETDARSPGQSLAAVLTALDDLLSSHGTVLITASIDDADTVTALLDHVDRAVAIADAASTRHLAHHAGRSVEIALLDGDSRTPAPRTVEQMPVVRAIKRGPNNGRWDAGDIAWLGRHLSRTKLGLALGAGGAKGYAHVAALQVLERAGYTVDYVAGSSIGAMVGAWLAMGRDAAAVEETMRGAFSPENVAAMFKLSLTGQSAGLDTMVRVCRETTEDRTFEDLVVPLVIMTVDLNTHQPAPINEGPLWQALLGATALAGMFPPYERDGQRLVDGLALVPVPTGALEESGADITVSVNIMSRDTLAAWPGQASPEPAPARAGSRMLDTLLEVMDLAQLDSSIRHAALADVVITPRFGPSSWRDFHLADLFLSAGYQAAEEQLASLRALANPQRSTLERKGEVYGDAAVHV